MSGRWICPICSMPLECGEKAWSCENGHAFDVAREGYVNLLTGRARSGHKGDAPDMLRARRRWFDGGWYEPLRRRLVELAVDDAGGSPVVAEAGCGEGYYIGGIGEAAPSAVCLGYDLAKDGARLAARRYPRARFAVADTNRGLPWATESVDVLLDVFAPRNAAEFMRVVRPGGRLIVVIPGNDHLGELREKLPLLAIQAEKRRLVEEAMRPGFELEFAEELRVPMVLSMEQTDDLIGMTPNAWFVPEENKNVLKDGEIITVTATFNILVFGRCSISETKAL